MRKFVTWCLLLASPALAGEEAVVTLHSTVTGSREQPKVMYLVPWQQPGTVRFEYALQGSFAAELFAPVDRAEFVRELEYRALLADLESAGTTAED